MGTPTLLKTKALEAGDCCARALKVNESRWFALAGGLQQVLGRSCSGRKLPEGARDWNEAVRTLDVLIDVGIKAGVGTLVQAGKRGKATVLADHLGRAD